MNRSTLSPSESRRLNGRASMVLRSLRCTPLVFLLAGFTWLLLSFLLGIAIIIGLVQGTPLPPWLKAIHVHGTLVGGLLQLAIGSFLLSKALLSDSKAPSFESHPVLFLALNGANVGLLLSFGIGNMTIAGLAGLLLLGTVFSLTKTAWMYFRDVLNQPAGATWAYRAALIALVLGLTAGVMMAFRLDEGQYIHLRLVHVHLILLGFLTVVSIAVLHQILPALTQKPLHNLRWGRGALWSLPAGFAVLLAGFISSSLILEIAVGCVLVVSMAFCTYNLTATWFKSGLPGNAASDHLLIGIVFLLFAMIAGLGMGLNSLRNPTVLPIGSLHIVAYTHLAFIGGMTQIVCGCLSFCVPAILTVIRVPASKKRQVYRAQLDEIMNRWRTIQLAGMSLGTMALSVLASLTWSLPLGSPYVQSIAWVAAGLLIVSLTLFTAKLAWALGSRPS